MTDRVAEERIGTITEMTGMIEAGTGLEKGHFPEIMATREIGVQAISRSRSGSRASTNRDRIRCYKCREYDHFMRDCPTSREEKEIEQLQQMLNLGDEQTSLTPLISNMQDNFSRTGSEENLRQGHLNCITGRNDFTTFLPLSPKIGGQVNNNNKPSSSPILDKRTGQLCLQKDRVR